MSTSKVTQVKGRLIGALSIFFVVGAMAQGVAHAGANALISNQASASGLPAGSQIYDSAMLGNGVDPNGALTFKLYAPDNPTCAGTPIYTSTTAVNGNGYY